MSLDPSSVLVVDDDNAVRTSLVIVLSAVGYHVRSAVDGLSALAEMRLEMPAILLADLHMPGMSGFDLLPVVRRSFPSVRVIAMTGASFEIDPLITVPADAFHKKGSSLLGLLKKLEMMASGSSRLESNSNAQDGMALEMVDSVSGVGGEVDAICRTRADDASPGWSVESMSKSRG